MYLLYRQAPLCIISHYCMYRIIIYHYLHNLSEIYWLLEAGILLIMSINTPPEPVGGFAFLNSPSLQQHIHK
jgi:hypothetical protein